MEMEEPEGIGEASNLFAALYYLVVYQKPVLVRYPFVTDARRVVEVSGDSWSEALKRFVVHSVVDVSYRAPFARDLDSLRTAVASVGAAF